MNQPASPRRFDAVAYLKLFRFPLVFTAIADSAAGYLLAQVYLTATAWQVLGCLALSSGGLYCFGMAMNDVADRKRDQEIAPTRVLPSGRLTLRAALIASFCILGVSLAALILAPGQSGTQQRLIVWGLVLAGILAYDFFLKVPPTMGFVRACNLILGISVGVSLNSSLMWIVVAVAIPEFVYVTALTYVSTLEDTGGRGSRLFIGAGLMALSALFAAHWNAVGFPIAEYLMGLSPKAWVTDWRMIDIKGFASIPALAIGLFLAAWILARAWKARDRKGIMLLVRDGVAGIILLNAALLAGAIGWKWGLLIAALLVPAILSLVILKRLA